MRGFGLRTVAAERSSDDVEGLLRDYFRSQLPNPWPELKLPEEVPPLRAARPFWSSRSALAAAVGFLLIGSLVLTAAFRGHGSAAHTGSGNFTAKGNPLGFTQPTSEPDHAR